MTDKIDKLLMAAADHVVFDGWTEIAFAACVQDAGLTDAEARAVCPRGAIDLAAAYHRAGDQKLHLIADLKDGMRYSEKVGALVWQRLHLSDKEMVRRGMTLYAMPAHAAEGAGLIWETADTIWTILGDTSDDLNWYSKRTILGGVIGSTNLYWLGDTSEGDLATKKFIDRRIANVMQFEKFKSDVRANKALGPLVAFQDKLFSSVRAPSKNARRDYPGWQEPKRTE